MMIKRSQISQSRKVSTRGSRTKVRQTRKASKTAVVYKPGQMEQSMRDTGSKAKLMDEVGSSTQKVTSKRWIGSMARLQARDIIFMLMARNTQAAGKMTSSTAMGMRRSLMAQFTRDSILRAINTAKGSSSGRMGTPMLDSLSRTI